MMTHSRLFGVQVMSRARMLAPASDECRDNEMKAGGARIIACGNKEKYSVIHIPIMVK